MRALLLKVLATGLTMLTAVASAAYVSSHVKNGAAPLHPPVGSAEGAGRLLLSAGVHASDVQAVTSTYAS